MTRSRLSRTTRVSKSEYGPYLAEFLWRESVLSEASFGTPVWEDHAFWALADLLSEHFWSKLVQSSGDDLMKLDPCVSAEFASLRPTPAKEPKGPCDPWAPTVTAARNQPKILDLSSLGFQLKSLRL